MTSEIRRRKKNKERKKERKQEKNHSGKTKSLRHRDAGRANNTRMCNLDIFKRDESEAVEIRLLLARLHIV